MGFSRVTLHDHHGQRLCLAPLLARHLLEDAGPEVRVGAGEGVGVGAEAAAVAGQRQPPVPPVRPRHVGRHVARAVRVAVQLRRHVRQVQLLLPCKSTSGYQLQLHSRTASLGSAFIRLPDMTSCPHWSKKLWRNIWTGEMLDVNSWL